MTAHTLSAESPPATGRLPEIWVADLVRALDAVSDKHPGERRRIACLLGFVEEPTSSVRRSWTPAPVGMPVIDPADGDLPAPDPVGPGPAYVSTAPGNHPPPELDPGPHSPP